jgi:hypothetical protein
VIDDHRDWLIYSPDDPAPEATEDTTPPDPFEPAPGPLPPVIPGETPEGSGKKRRVRLFHADGTAGDEDDWDWGEFKKTGDIVLGGTDFPPTAPKVGHKGKPKKQILEYKPLDAEDLIPDSIPDSQLRAIPWTMRGTTPPYVLFVEIFRDLLKVEQPLAESEAPAPEAKPASEPD